MNEELRKRIAELEAELAQHEWVSVEDRLPEEFDSYFVHCEVVGGFMADWCSDKNWWTGDGVVCDVTHWKPITLPKKGKDNG